MPKVKIITHSGSDLTQDMVSDLDITILPDLVAFGSEQYLNNVDIHPTEFYHRIESGDVFPTSAHPTLNDFIEVFQDAEGYDEILCMVMSSKMTSTVNTANIAARMVEEDMPGTKIYVYDSMQVSFGLGLAVLMDASSFFRKAIYPVVVASQTIPTTAIAPLFVLWFGYGIWSKVLVTVLITFFPITITVYDGLQSAKVEMTELLLTYGATKCDIFLKIKVPCTLPYFFSAVKMSIPMSIIGAAIGEWLGAQRGLGYFPGA